MFLVLRKMRRKWKWQQWWVEKKRVLPVQMIWGSTFKSSCEFNLNMPHRNRRVYWETASWFLLVLWEIWCCFFNQHIHNNIRTKTWLRYSKCVHIVRSGCWIPRNPMFARMQIDIGYHGSITMRLDSCLPSNFPSMTNLGALIWDFLWTYAVHFQLLLNTCCKNRCTAISKIILIQSIQKKHRLQQSLTSALPCWIQTLSQGPCSNEWPNLVHEEWDDRCPPGDAQCMSHSGEKQMIYCQ